MPPPFKVELRPHDPQWASKAEDERQALAAAMGSCLLNVHHIGSTAIPNIHAKPVLARVHMIARRYDARHCIVMTRTPIRPRLQGGDPARCV
jgi:hypothetical protein